MVEKTRRYDRVASEKKLLAAAEEVFAKEGFKGATTRAIAKKAGLNIANIAHYFGDKEGLLMRILQEEIASSRDKKLPYPPQDNLLDELLNYGKFGFDYYLEKISLIRIICGQFMTDAKFHKKFYEIINLVARNQELEARLEHLQKTKKISDKFPPTTIIDDVDDQIIMLVLSELILRLEPEEKVRKTFERYIHIYSNYLKVSE